jgi:site-specific DNA-adenine methylase
MNIDHPGVIPYGVMDRIIKMIPEDYVIVDPFCGTGTTLVAAKKKQETLYRHREKSRILRTCET